MKKKILAIGGLALLLVLGAACGGQTAAEATPQPAAAGRLAVTDVTANLSLPTSTGAVYMLITNSSGTDDALLGATIPGCGAVELHEMTMDGDVMVMREVENGRIPIPAGQTVMLQRGGLHVMCLQKAEPVAPGQMVPVTLEFERAGIMEVQAMTIDISGEGMDMEEMPSSQP